MPGIVCDHADRHAFYTYKSGDDAICPVLANLEHGIHIGDAFHDLAHVVVTQAVFRHHEAQFTDIGCFPIFHRTLEVGQIFLGHKNGLCLVLHGDVHHTVGHLYVHGTHFFRREDTQPTAFYHGRPADTDV